METKHKPATALPWGTGPATTRIAVDGQLGIWAGKRGVADVYGYPQTAAYIAHAANAYPQLVAALRDLREAALLARTDAAMSYDAVQRADEVLRSLGELK